VGNNLYNFYNRALPEREEREFEEHLLLCFYCQETILTLDRIFDALRESETLFRPRGQVSPIGLLSELGEAD
jgi:hypothetical protein